MERPSDKFFHKRGGFFTESGFFRHQGGFFSGFFRVFLPRRVFNTKIRFLNGFLLLKRHSHRGRILIKARLAILRRDFLHGDGIFLTLQRDYISLPPNRGSIIKAGLHQDRIAPRREFLPLEPKNTKSTPTQASHQCETFLPRGSLFTKAGFIFASARDLYFHHYLSYSYFEIR